MMVIGEKKAQVEAGLRSSAQHVTEETSKVLQQLPNVADICMKDRFAQCQGYERFMCKMSQIREIYLCNVRDIKIYVRTMSKIHMYERYINQFFGPN